MNKTKIFYWDFDGTFADTPHPEIGKPLWAQFYGIPYPHIGWWGRLESMDKNVFTITPRPQVLEMFLQHQGPECIHYIHTSRQPKFEDRIKEILKDNNIHMDAVMTVKGSIHKGDRIVQSVQEQITYFHNHITDVYFFDDRNKEIDVVESVRDELNYLGVNLHITKIESDAKD
jgi:hypothetical protein